MTLEEMEGMLDEDEGAHGGGEQGGKVEDEDRESPAIWEDVTELWEEITVQYI